MEGSSCASAPFPYGMASPPPQKGLFWVEALASTAVPVAGKEGCGCSLSAIWPWHSAATLSSSLKQERERRFSASPFLKCRWIDQRLHLEWGRNWEVPVCFSNFAFLKPLISVPLLSPPSPSPHPQRSLWFCFESLQENDSSLILAGSSVWWNTGFRSDKITLEVIGLQLCFSVRNVEPSPWSVNI